MIDYTGLNPEQYDAVKSRRSRILCIAGAGTGKTKVLTTRVARLIEDEGIAPDHILCVTFTRDAAAEMRHRLEGMLRRPSDVPEVRTLHSWSLQQLRDRPELFHRTRDFTVYDDTDRTDIIRACARDLGNKMWERSRISTLWREESVRQLYDERLTESNAFDFNMLEDCALILISNDEEAASELTKRYKHVLVDEYQDTNLTQVAILRGLVPENFFVVGDPRQSIYRFRGAEPATIVEMAIDADFRLVELITNYRSLQEIVTYANGCVSGPWEPMVSERGTHTGGPILTAHHTGDQPGFVAGAIRDLIYEGAKPGSIAVLGRHWSDLKEVYDALYHFGVSARYYGTDTDPWATNDGRSLARMLLLLRNPSDNNLAAFLANWGKLGGKRFKDVQAHRARAIRERTSLFKIFAELDETWMSLLLLTADVHQADVLEPAAVAEEVISIMGLRYVYGARDLTSRLDALDACLAELRELDTDLDGFAEWWTDRSIQERIRKAGTDQVHVMTVHASKGLEFDTVFAIGCRDGAFPSNRKSDTDEDREEDLRVWYVMVTRAKNRLALVAPKTFKPPWKNYAEPAAPSPFLFLPDNAPNLEEEDLAEAP